jgi:hypothetical protein
MTGDGEPQFHAVAGCSINSDTKIHGANGTTIIWIGSTSVPKPNFSNAWKKKYLPKRLPIETLITRATI